MPVVMGGNSKHMQTSHQLVLRMVCSPLRALFLEAGVANRVRIISLIFSVPQRCQQGTGWGGLVGSHLDNVIIKVRVLKIDWCCQIWQVLSINYWFRPWKRAQHLLGRFRAPQWCSSQRFHFPLLPFPCLWRNNCILHPSNTYIMLIECIIQLLLCWTVAQMGGCCDTCCCGCAQLRHALALFFGLPGFSTPQEPAANTGIQVYCTKNHQMSQKIKLTWPMLGQWVWIPLHWSGIKWNPAGIGGAHERPPSLAEKRAGLELWGMPRAPYVSGEGQQWRLPFWRLFQLKRTRRLW